MLRLTSGCKAVGHKRNGRLTSSPQSGSKKPSAVSGQKSAVSDQKSAISRQPSALRRTAAFFLKYPQRSWGTLIGRADPPTTRAINTTLLWMVSVTYCKDMISRDIGGYPGRATAGRAWWVDGTFIAIRLLAPLRQVPFLSPRRNRKTRVTRQTSQVLHRLERRDIPL